MTYFSDFWTGACKNVVKYPKLWSHRVKIRNICNFERNIQLEGLKLPIIIVLIAIKLLQPILGVPDDLFVRFMDLGVQNVANIQKNVVSAGQNS